ncbi:MAG TPA: hypothetical protein VK766_01550 [Cytophagaceae bacterium]|nr:hypothetical protein [Cytophagaceae bacterium]
MLKNKLSEVKTEVSDFEWEEVNSALKRRMFFKFNKNTFNIYYLTTGIGLFGIYSYILLNMNTLSENSISDTKQIDTVYIRDTIYEHDIVSKNNQRTLKGPRKPTFTETIESPVAAKQNPIVEEQPINNEAKVTHIQKDSMITKPKQEPSVTKGKKIKYVIKRDTIYQIDTSFIKKKKRTN